jgi:hypothetical protein
VSIAPSRTRPLIAVLSGVPLFVEAMTAAFAGIADIQVISSRDIEAHGLLRAFRPDAVIVEGAPGEFVDEGLPGVQVDLQARTVSARRGAEWHVLNVELSPEAIRNVAVAALYGGDPA